MNDQKLKSLVTIFLGMNAIRIKRTKGDVYKVDDMNADLEKMYQLDSEDYGSTGENAGDVIFNLNTYEASIISIGNADKILDRNFIIFKCNPEKLDPRYLCFILNCSDDVKRQEASRSQGDVVKRLATQDIKELEIPLLPLERQRLLGRIYAMQIHYQWLTKQKMQLMNSAVGQVLKLIAEPTEEA